MNYNRKSKEQIINELEESNIRIAELEKTNIRSKQVREELLETCERLELAYADISKQNQTEAAERQYYKNIELLSETAMQFFGFPPDKDIYTFIGNKLQEYIGTDSFIVVNSVDADKNTLTTRTVLGMGKMTEKVIKILGVHPVGMVFNAKDEDLLSLADGNLKLYRKGLYDIMLKSVPERVSKSLERLLKIDKIYGIGFTRDNELAGTIIIFLRKGADELRNMQLVEAFLKQASIAIQKRKAEEELIIALKKAEESDHLKTAFLANMSHEIRTPMNGILGFASLLKKPGLSIDEQQKFIEIIESSGERMLNIINDLINISKIESGQMDVSFSRININEEIEELSAFFKPELDQKGMQFDINYSLKAEEASLYTDKDKLDAILTNLIKNAIKYSNEGIIELGYNLKNGFIEFFVKDSGIGIAKDQIKNIFKRFVQAELGYTRSYEGAGLGLSIAQAYVNMLDGEIWVESKEEVGSQFYFTIPYKKHSEKHSIQKASDNNLVPQNFMENLCILIVEDEDTADLYLTSLLKRKCKKILHAKTGIEAINLCRENKDIDLILMDIKMPQMDGYEATRIIREFNKDVKIIAQTAYALQGSREMAMEAGCNDYISKPIPPGVLMTAIGNSFK